MREFWLTLSVAVATMSRSRRASIRTGKAASGLSSSEAAPGTSRPKNWLALASPPATAVMTPKPRSGKRLRIRCCKISASVCGERGQESLIEADVARAEACGETLGEANPGEGERCGAVREYGRYWGAAAPQGRA